MKNKNKEAFCDGCCYRKTCNNDLEKCCYLRQNKCVIYEKIGPIGFNNKKLKEI